jgi:hypothetical protein
LLNVRGLPRRLLVAAADAPERVDDDEKLFKVFIGPHLLEQSFPKKFPQAESFGQESESDIM